MLKDALMHVSEIWIATRRELLEGTVTSSGGTSNCQYVRLVLESCCVGAERLAGALSLDLRRRCNYAEVQSPHSLGHLESPQSVQVRNMRKEKDLAMEAGAKHGRSVGISSRIPLSIQRTYSNT